MEAERLLEQEGEIDESLEDSSFQVKKQKKEEKIDRLCNASLKRISSDQAVWVIAISVSVLIFLVVASIIPGVSSGTEGNWVLGVLAGFLMIFSIVRICSNSSFSKKLHNRKRYINNLPKESNAFVRELYLHYCSKRCVIFWCHALFGSLFFLSVLYVMAGSGIDCAVGKGTPTKLKLFGSTFAAPSSWDISHKVFVGGLAGLLLSILSFLLARDKNDRVIYALEEKYGRERIVDECLWFSRIQKVNFKYKTIVFAIVCLTGCFFFLFFKRLICTIFDKSFVM